MSDANRVAFIYGQEDSFKVFNNTATMTETTLSMTASDNSINDSADGFVSNGFVVGQRILVSGFTGDTSNNQNYRIFSVAIGKMVLTEGTVVDDAAAEAVTVTAGVMKELRFTGESFQQNTGSIQSAEIRSDRQIPAIIRNDVGASGDVNFEFSYEEFDDFLQAGIQGASWSSEASDTQTTFSMDAGDNSINDSGSGFVAAGFVANQFIKVSGFTGDVVNNTMYKIVSVITGKMVLAGNTVVADTAGESVTIVMGSQIVNGTTDRSFLFEREYEDIANEFAVYDGCKVDTMNLTMGADTLVTGTFGFLGATGDSATSTVATATEAANVENITNAIDDVDSINDNDTDATLTAFSFDIANNLRQRKVIGTLGADSIGSGSIGITGTVQKFFESKTLMDKYLDFTTSSLTLMMEDSNGKGYIVDFPSIKYTDGKRVAGGINTDIIADMTFSAFMDTSELITIRIARFAA